MAPIPITGTGAINALGSSKTDIVKGLRAGSSPLKPPPFLLPFTTVSGVVEDKLAPLEGELKPYDTRLAQMTQHLVRSLEAPIQRVRARWSPHRVGVFLGTSTAGAATTERAYAEFLQTGSLPSHYNYRTQHTFGATLEVVRKMTGFEGPGWVISTACTSSAKTLGSAARLIEGGLIDAALVGGIDTLCAMTLQGFWSLGALSADRCRPFSTKAAGINIGEGGAFLILERSGEAEALLEGVGESSDAYHISAPHPEGLGARLAMERALAPGLTPKNIDHVNAHGTGTIHNDQMESKAIREFLGSETPIISTKGYTGHTLGGAGAVEAVLSIWMMQDNFIASSLGTEPVNPEYGINVLTGSESVEINRVMSNSFAFGGNNISICLRSA